MSNDISGISDEVFFSSLSKRMDREIHFSDECKAVERYGELNENGRIVIVFIRICRCGKKENKSDVLSGEKRLVLPTDGVDIHKIGNCEYISEKNFDSSLRRHVYRFRLTCHCAARHGTKRILDYN